MPDYTIRRSTRAKKMRLIANLQGGVELVLPKFVPEFMGKAFASLHLEWIEKQSKKSKNTLPLIPTEDGAAIFFMGTSKFRLQIEKTEKKASFWKKNGENLGIFLSTKPGSGAMIEKNCEKNIADLVENFYRTEAKSYLAERTTFFAEKLGVSFGNITIRGQKTRWGSCSGKGNLNYNWKIMKESPEVIDYLVIHELCHRKEMNHSKRFWDLVESLDSDYKTHRQALK